MKPGLLAGLIVALILSSGAFAMFVPSALSPQFGTTDGSDSFLECEDLFDGDRIEIRDDGAGGRREIRVESDTRVRAEARFEQQEGSAVRREARIEFCGVVEFVDEDGDGGLGAADTIMRSELVRFGSIEHEPGDVHRFEVASREANLTITIRIPDAMPPSDAPLIEWTVVADPDCLPGATHFAVKVEREQPSNRDEFAASPCGTPLQISGDETSSIAGPVPPVAFECDDETDGTEFEFSLVRRLGGVEERWEGRVEADTRVRAEVRFADGGSVREARLEICGLLQFADEDGDGHFGPGDTIVSRLLVPFGTLLHRVDGGVQAFTSRSEPGNLSIAIGASTTFPVAGEPLLRWAVEAGPACAPGATHFAIQLEQAAPPAADRFLAGECGSTLSVAGEIG